MRYEMFEELEEANTAIGVKRGFRSRHYCDNVCFYEEEKWIKGLGRTGEW